MAVFRRQCSGTQFPFILHAPSVIALLWSLAVIVFGSESRYYMTIDASVTPTQLLRHFWRSTGFCPPEPHQLSWQFDLGSDMQHNLVHIAAAPHGALQQVRIHWLLDLVMVSSVVGNQPVYNFSQLDALVTLLHDADLIPGFELMGNPSNIFSDFGNKSQIFWWRDLVYQLAKRYIDMFGLDYVSQWNFETWNEPDCGDFDKVNMTVQGFLNYYDACSEGLKAASSRLRFGGPGDGCKRHAYLDALLQHVTQGKNFFTGETGVRIDFISLHKKGMGFSATILLEEAGAWKSISEKYPSLVNKPFYNDEADPLVGWSKAEEWRADATYAAMVAKVIAQHQNVFIASQDSPIPNYGLLSNDNGFLSYFPHQFTQRTLLARLQINTTHPPHTHFLRKPVLATMGLLARLGEYQLPLTLTDGGGHQVGNLSTVGVLASIHRPTASVPSDSWHISVLVSHSEDTLPLSSVASLDLAVSGLPNVTDDWMLMVWTVNQTAGNPYSLWKSAGSPAFPSLELFKLLRQNEGPVLSLRQRVGSEGVRLRGLTLPLPSVQLLHLCGRPAAPPEQVSRVQVKNITSGQVLITWSDRLVHTRCVLTSEVEFSRGSASGPYVRISEGFSIFNSFVFAPVKSLLGDDQEVWGFYQVRLLDYWDRPGPYSVPVQYPGPQSLGAFVRPKISRESQGLGVDYVPRS